MFKVLGAFCVVMAGAVPAMAAPAPVLCDMNWQGHDNWIPAQVAVLHQAGTKTAKVDDPIIEHTMGAPVDAKVTADNGTRLSLSWSIIGRSTTGNRFRMNYSLTIQKATMRASMTARPAGFDNSYSTGGTCKQR